MSPLYPTRHWWFNSGKHWLLGHVDVPQGNIGRAGVVIVPPFGWEDVCSYRPLRFMAQALAQAGIPALRYDLPGTGDSSSDALDPGLFDSWIESVGDAATELRNTTGVDDIAAVGVHLGAMLAMVSASHGATFQKLVLWGPAAHGRTILRELRATANVERWESLPDQDAPPQPLPGFQVGGFLIAPETQRALEDLDISALSWPQAVRVLLLSRDDLSPDAKLFQALRCSAVNVQAAAGPGYSAMMATPQEAPPPELVSRLIVEFIRSEVPGHARRDAIKSPALRPATAGTRVNDDCIESIYRIETPSLGMFGILAEPAQAIHRGESCILYLNPGGVRHIGPNRMWVESARCWAAQGVPSLRFDLQSIGESAGKPYLDVPSLYREPFMEQIEVAIDSLRSNTGIKRFVAIGLCSGACWAFHAAIRNPDVRGAILLNPSLLYWDPGAERRRLLRDVAAGYARWAEWSRMVRSGIQRGDVVRAARRLAERLGRMRTRQDGYLQLGFKAVAQVWSFLEQNQKSLTLLFREGEPLLAELEAAGQLPLDHSIFVRCVRVPNSGHTFRPLWAQRMVHNIMDVELAAMLGAPVESKSAIAP